MAVFADDNVPGTMLHDRAAGLSARLFVAPPPEAHGFADAAAPIALPPVVNAAVSKRLAKGLSLDFDVTNVFDRSIPREDWLLQPPQPRGFVLQLRKTF